jgi:hypothetical protein
MRVSPVSMTPATCRPALINTAASARCTGQAKARRNRFQRFVSLRPAPLQPDTCGAGWLGLGGEGVCHGARLEVLFLGLTLIALIDCYSGHSRRGRCAETRAVLATVGRSVCARPVFSLRFHFVDIVHRGYTLSTGILAGIDWVDLLRRPSWRLEGLRRRRNGAPGRAAAGRMPALPPGRDGKPTPLPPSHALGAHGRGVIQLCPLPRARPVPPGAERALPLYPLPLQGNGAYISPFQAGNIQKSPMILAPYGLK